MVEAEAGKPSPFHRDRGDERREKREALLRVAVSMFNERGFHATSLDDVAASLGVTKPVIYHYLGNKDQVLFECVRVGLTELQGVAEDVRSEPGTGLDRLRTFLQRYARVVMGDFGRCMIRTGDEVLTEETRRKFRELKREIDASLRSMVEAAAADGSADVQDVRTVAFAFAGALNWSARWYDPGGAIDPETMARNLVDVLCGGIEPGRDKGGECNETAGAGQARA